MIRFKSFQEFKAATKLVNTTLQIPASDILFQQITKDLHPEIKFDSCEQLSLTFESNTVNIKLRNFVYSKEIERTVYNTCVKSLTGLNQDY